MAGKNPRILERTLESLHAYENGPPEEYGSDQRPRRRFGSERQVAARYWPSPAGWRGDCRERHSFPRLGTVLAAGESIARRRSWSLRSLKKHALGRGERRLLLGPGARRGGGRALQVPARPRDVSRSCFVVPAAWS